MPFDLQRIFDSKRAYRQTLAIIASRQRSGIDALVYELYGLTAEEIRIVEGSA